MAYEFKKLGDVEALEEVPENANALIEVDGAIKRVPGSNLGGGGGGDGTVVLFDLDEAACSVSHDELCELIEAGAPISFMVRRTVDGTLHHKAPTDVTGTSFFIIHTDLSWNSTTGEVFFDGQYGFYCEPEDEPE